MIKFNGTYTPEWQEELNDTKLGQLCGNRDVLEYTIAFDRPSIDYHLGIFFEDLQGRECYILDEISPATVARMYKTIDKDLVRTLVEEFKLVERAWEHVYG